MQSVRLGVPGRKTDVTDAQWLCQLMEAGLLRGSFVPPEAPAALRTLTRYRKTQIAERSARPTGCTRRWRTPASSSTASPPTSSVSPGARCSTRSCRDHRPRDPRRARQGPAAREDPRAHERRSRAASRPIHALVIGAILAHLDFLDEQITGSPKRSRNSSALSRRRRAREHPHRRRKRTAEVMVAEIGVDMTMFPTAGHLASWAGQCPGNDQSAGKRRSGRTRKGSKWLGIALEEAALAATRTKGSYLQAQYQRLRPRIGHGRALGAVKHSILSPTGTCSPPARPTANSAATTTPDATRTADPTTRRPAPTTRAKRRAPGTDACRAACPTEGLFSRVPFRAAATPTFGFGALACQSATNWR